MGGRFSEGCGGCGVTKVAKFLNVELRNLRNPRKLRKPFYTSCMAHRIALPLLTILLVCSATLGGLLISSSPTSWDDGLRHLAMAKVMQQEGIAQTWDRFLYGGYLAEHPVDPWFLADVSYIPFTKLDPAIALKLYAVLGIAALMAALWYPLARLKLSPALTSILLLFVAVPEPFYGRLLLGRPFVWSTVFSILALAFVLRRSFLPLGVLLFIATLFSQLFIFPLCLAACGVLWLFLLGEKTAATTMGIAAALGTAAGAAAHPDALAYVVYIATVFLRIPFEARSLNLGTEMYPGLSMATAPLAILGALVLICAGARSHGYTLSPEKLHKDGTTLIAALSAVSFLGFCFAWNRLIDILLPLLVLLTAYVLKHVEPFTRGLFSVRLAPVLPRVRGGAVLTAAIGILALSTIARLSLDLYTTGSDRSLAHAAVLADLPAGSRVLNPEWYLVPVLIHSNPGLRFATGIDNTFMAVTDREAYMLFDVLFSSAAALPLPVVDTQGWLAQLLKKFPSDYLVLSNSWGKNMLPLLRETPGLTALTESGAVIEVFEIKDDFGGATVAHFQRFVSLTANIGRFSQELADLQESMWTLRDLLVTPSPVQFDRALTL